MHSIFTAFSGSDEPAGFSVLLTDLRSQVQEGLGKVTNSYCIMGCRISISCLFSFVVNKLSNMCSQEILHGECKPGSDADHPCMDPGLVCEFWGFGGTCFVYILCSGYLLNFVIVFFVNESLCGLGKKLKNLSYTSKTFVDGVSGSFSLMGPFWPHSHHIVEKCVIVSLCHLKHINYNKFLNKDLLACCQLYLAAGKIGNSKWYLNQCTTNHF